MKSYSWIFLDADNTLLDFDRAEEEALAQGLLSEGMSFIHEHYLVYKRINKACWKDLERGLLDKDTLKLRRFELFLEAVGADGDAAAISARYTQYLSTMGHLLDGAADLLDALAANHKLALVTNGIKEIQEPRLQRAGILPYFQQVVISEDTGYAKPHRGFFDHAFERAGHPDPGEVLMVGDNYHADIQGALAYGMDGCWYNPYGYDAEGGTIPHTYEIEALSQLLEII